MKLLIDCDLTLELNKESIELLKNNSVTIRESGAYTTILAQKITLNEIDMNELFDEVFWGYEIKYANLGGRGCDFSIRINSDMF